MMELKLIKELYYDSQDFKYFDDFLESDKKAFIKKYLKHTSKLKNKTLNLNKLSMKTALKYINNSEKELSDFLNTFNIRYLKNMIKGNSFELHNILVGSIGIKTCNDYLNVFKKIKKLEFEIRDLKLKAGVLNIGSEYINTEYHKNDHDFENYDPNFQDYDTNTIITLGIGKLGEILTVRYAPILLSQSSSEYYAYYYPYEPYIYRINKIEKFLIEKDFELDENLIKQSSKYKQLRRDIFK